MKGILEYYDKYLECYVQVDIEADTLLQARNACKDELKGKKYSEPALYLLEEE